MLLSVALLCGCAAPPNQEQAGMVIGGALGGALGSQIGGGEGRTVAAVIGTLFGAAVGGNVGRSMDDSDRIKVSRTLENVRTGVAAQWVNPDTGNHYTVVPNRTFETAGVPCREFTVNGIVGGQHQKIIGTACRQADGSWQMNP